MTPKTSYRLDPGHPPPEKLAAFLEGRLSRAEHDALEPHVAQCDSCCQALRQVPPDRLTEEIRAGSSWVGTAVTDASNPAEALANHPRYHLLEPLGTGGMGAVYKARHLLMGRVVALKVIHRRLLRRPEAVERFRREVQAAASLAHPNIVTAHDADRAGDCHFLVMEFIEGKSLAELVKERGPLTVREACDYICQAARGLQHAYEHGMVHRDIKPQNLMLTPQGQVKVLDFGLAHIAGDSGPAGLMAASPDGAAPLADLTQASTMLGTPDYMAPEQSKDPRAVDVRTDIYALGCTLYYLLTGEPPFPEGAAATKVAAHRQQSPRSLTACRRDVPPEVARVVERMLAKEPSERYQTPAEVADALAPRPLHVVRSARRWLPLLLTGVAAVGVVIAAIIYVNSGPGTVATVREPAANVPLKESEPLSLPPDLLPAAQRIQAGLPRDAADQAVAALRQELIAYRARHPGSPEAIQAARLMARLAWPADALQKERINLEELTAAGDGDPRQAPASVVAILGDARLKHWSYVNCVAISKDGKTLASGGYDGVVRVWDAATGKPRHVLRGHADEVLSLAISPDGATLASAGTDWMVRLWDLATGKERHACMGHGSWVNSVAFRSDGRVLYSGGRDGTARLWNVADGKELDSLRLSEVGDEILCLALSPDDKTLASAGRDNKVKIWDAITGRELHTFEGHRYAIWLMAFSPDSRMLASASWDGTVKLWDVVARKERHTLSGHKNLAFSVGFNPDCKTVATGDGEGAVRLWDVASGELRSTLPCHHWSVRGLVIAGDGTTLVSGSYDNDVHLWDIAAQKARVLYPGPTSLLAGIAVSPDGRRVAAACQDGSVHLWDVYTGKGRLILRGGSGINGVAFSPDGRTLAAACQDGTVLLWDAAAEREGRVLKAGRHARAVTFSPDGHTLAAADWDGEVRLWDVTTWERLPGPENQGLQLWSVAFSPDGKTLAAAGNDGTVQLWDFPGRQLRHTCQLGKGTHIGLGAIVSLDFSPDSTTLAAAGHGNQAVVLWDVNTGQRQEAALKHTREPLGVAYSPDGSTLASVGQDGTVRLWDPATGRQRQAISLGLPRRDIYHVAFTPDGRHVVTANGNGTVYMLRLGSAR